MTSKLISICNEHLKHIFDDGELNKNSAVRKIRTTASDSKKYKTSFYNLDAIISVGYRINFKNATHFRIWATEQLKELIIKNFVLNHEILKNDSRFGRKYRIIQDRNYQSDFDEWIIEIKRLERVENN